MVQDSSLFLFHNNYIQYPNNIHIPNNYIVRCDIVFIEFLSNRFADDIEFMTGKRPWIGWMICWKYISPLALFIVLVALIAQQSQSPPAYSRFVGCLQVSVYFIRCRSESIFMYLSDYMKKKSLIM